MSTPLDRIAHRQLSRRSMVLGGTAFAVGATGAAIAIGHGGNPTKTSAAPVDNPTSVPQAFQDQAATPTDVPAAVIAPPSTAVPAGMAIISSPRVPLFDLASQDVPGIVSGSISSWITVGSAVDQAIVVVALEGTTIDGLAPTKTYQSYDRLAQFLNSPDGFGGVAIVPADQVDARVNVLAVDGYDPVRMGQFDEPVFRIGYVGDIVPGRNVGIKMEQYNDYTHPFHRVADILSSFDLTVANFEGNVSDNIDAPADPNTFSFISPTKMLDGFTLAGIDVVSLANNHSVWNDSGWGTAAFTDTLDALAAHNINVIGGGRTLEQARFAYTTTIGGTTIALIGIDAVTANVEARDYGATVNDSYKGGDKYAGATDDTPGTNPYDPESLFPIFRLWPRNTMSSSPISTWALSMSRSCRNGQSTEPEARSMRAQPSS